MSMSIPYDERHAGRKERTEEIKRVVDGGTEHRETSEQERSWSREMAMGRHRRWCGGWRRGRGKNGGRKNDPKTRIWEWHMGKSSKKDLASLGTMNEAGASRTLGPNTESRRFHKLLQSHPGIKYLPLRRHRSKGGRNEEKRRKGGVRLRNARGNLRGLLR